MPNTYYAPGADRAQKVRELFAAIAPRYDLVNDLQSFGLHRLWKRKLVRLANVQRNERVLDLCCGTGDVALSLLREGASVIALDFSNAMLKIGHNRLAALPPISHFDLLQADAEQLPFRDNVFGAVTVSYGLRNLRNWELGLREMWRVARPSGRVIVLDFGKPDNVVWQWLYFTYLRLAVPIFGRVFARNAAAYSYILESLRAYPAQAGVAAQMSKLGCCDIRVLNLLGGAMSLNYATKR